MRPGFPRRCALLVAALAAIAPHASVSGQGTRAGATVPGGSYPARCGVGIPSDEQNGYVPLPRGDVFCPLLADPKSAQSFVSYLHEGSAGAPDTSIQIGSVGLGDSFGLGRWGGSRAGDGSQFSLMGAVFAQFDLGAESYDLLNADYVIGLANTVRRGWFSSRLRIYHQSSHLGDELLLREGGAVLERENLSFESLELLLSADAAALRVYGGGEFLFNRTPDDLERYVARAGLEVRPLARIISLGGLGGFRFVGAADLKASQEQDWDPSVSARAGFEYDRAGDPTSPARRWRLLFEYYRGPSPYGQFFRQNVRHIGAGLHFGL